jgi:hypothetical protein
LALNTYTLTSKSDPSRTPPDLYRLKKQDGSMIAECIRGAAATAPLSETDLIGLFGHGTQNVRWWGMPMVRMYVNREPKCISFELIGAILTLKDKAASQSVTVTTETSTKSSVDTSVFDGIDDEEDTYAASPSDDVDMGF